MIRSSWSRLGVLAICFAIAYPAISRERQEKTVGKTQNSGAANKQTPEIYADSDAYEIYGVLLKNLNRSQYIIEDQTPAHPNLTAAGVGIKGECLKEWAPVVQDFAERNRTGRKLSRNFPPSISYKLLSRAEINEMLVAKEAEPSSMRPPGSGESYTFSAVGFNHDRTYAIVKLTGNCPGLCGSTVPYFFEKHGTVWSEVHPKCEVVVIAS